MRNNEYQPVTATTVADLTAIVGAENVSTTEADRRARSEDVSNHPACLSDVIVWPKTPQQTAEVLQYAHQQRLPVTPWGAGTSAEGNPIPVYGGVLLSTERMNDIIAIHPEDSQVTVQAGVKYRDLNHALAEHDLFFPVDPGGDATIGDMLANNAAGPKTVKYGASKDNVLGLQVALADGRLLNLGSRSLKQSSGYDLLHLIVGSEGTLGFITEATLKLVPLPKHMSAVVAAFETVEDAVKSVVAIRRSGLDPAALEFIDADTARMLNHAEAVDLEEAPTLFMEFHAPHESLLEMGLTLVREICERVGLKSFHATTDAEERTQLWYARHNAFTIATETHADERFLILDAAVPISAYPAIVEQVQDGLQAHAITGYMMGHAGDGNMHVLIPYGDDATYEEAMTFNGEMITRALELGGTATGEHGVGLGKPRYMQQEHGLALDVMREIKTLLDAHGILNPGKIFPA